MHSILDSFYFQRKLFDTYTLIIKLTSLPISKSKADLSAFHPSASIPKLSVIADNQGMFIKFDKDTMSQIHKSLFSNYKMDLKLLSFTLSFADPCSNKLIQIMANEDNFSKEVKTAVENGTPLDNLELI